MSLAEIFSSFNVTPEKRSVIVFEGRVTEMPSIVNAASVAATTCVAESLKTPLFSGSYLKTLPGTPDNEDVIRIALAKPSGDFNIIE